MGNDNGSVNPRSKDSSKVELDAPQPVIDPILLNSLEWRLIGPFRGGRVVAVAGDPKHSQVFYFGSTGGGVWKTTDWCIQIYRWWQDLGTSWIGEYQKYRQGAHSPSKS